ncbi:MAG: hypothetical protein AAFN92_11550 [Bacteroidota bacterium]
MLLTNIQEALSQGQTGEAIEHLKKWTSRHGDQRLRNRVTLLSGRWNRLRDAEIDDQLPPDHINLETSRINNAILQLLEDAKQSPSGQEQLKNVLVDTVLPEPPPSVRESLPNASARRKTAILVGSALAISLLLLVAIIPCPSSAQYELFHVLLALAAGGLAAALTDYLIATQTAVIRVTGGLAVFALVFFFRPEQGFAEGKCEPAGPFTFTLALDPALPGRDYPEFDVEFHRPQLWVGNSWLDGSVDKNSVVDWKNLNPSLRNQRLPFRFNPDPYAVWQPVADSVLVGEGPTPLLKLVPNDALGRLRGRVTNQAGELIAGAIIAFEGVKDTSNTDGRFQLDIPPNRQQESYLLETRKADYAIHIGIFYPHAGIEIVLTK